MQLRTQIEALSDDLTTAERKLAAVLLSDYPFAGLENIQILAERTTISAPSITRFVHKIGCTGYQDFQRRLISELKESQRSPIDLHSNRKQPKADFLRSSLIRTAELISAAADGVTEAQFSRVCSLLADEKRAIFCLGGRISDPLAQYLSRHLRQVRRNVFHLPSDPDVWPEYLLRMRARDIFFIVDFRRYQKKLFDISSMATRTRGVNVILLTDKWMSPVAKQATDVMAVPIEIGTAWDSYSGALALIEAIITHVGEQDWNATSRRIEDWDAVRLDLGGNDEHL